MQRDSSLWNNLKWDTKQNAKLIQCKISSRNAKMCLSPTLHNTKQNLQGFLCGEVFFAKYNPDAKENSPPCGRKIIYSIVYIVYVV